MIRRPLKSLNVFRLMKTGSDAPVIADALEDVNLISDINAPLVLPEAVNAVMTDNSRSAVPVTWDLTEEEERRMHEKGPAEYLIKGTAGGMEARAYVSMVEYNYLTDYSFEDGGIGWVFTDLNHADELYVEDKKTDSLTGTKHAHFWSAAAGSVTFTLEQTVSDLPAGTYSFSIAIMGGDAGEHTVYAYVRENGEIIATAPMKITSYGSWDIGTVPAFEHADGASLTVGIYVECRGAGNGAWGKIDDAKLNSVR